MSKLSTELKETNSLQEGLALLLLSLRLPPWKTEVCRIIEWHVVHPPGCNLPQEIFHTDTAFHRYQGQNRCPWKIKIDQSRDNLNSHSRKDFIIRMIGCVDSDSQCNNDSDHDLQMALTYLKRQLFARHCLEIRCTVDLHFAIASSNWWVTNSPTWAFCGLAISGKFDDWSSPAAKEVLATRLTALYADRSCLRFLFVIDKVNGKGGWYEGRWWQCAMQPAPAFYMQD